MLKLLTMGHKLTIVLCSVRHQRRGAAISDWLMSLVKADERFEVSIADLREIDLPYEMDFTEPSEREDKKYPNLNIQKWSDTVDSSNAIIFVLPEYNHAAPASLKNAIDQIYYEWLDKAVGFVSYGGKSAGKDSVASLQYTAKSLRWRVAQPQINIKSVKQSLDDEGNFVDNSEYEELLKLMLNDFDRELNQ